MFLLQNLISLNKQPIFTLDLKNPPRCAIYSTNRTETENPFILLCVASIDDAHNIN